MKAKGLLKRYHPHMTEPAKLETELKPMMKPKNGLKGRYRNYKNVA